MLTSSSDPRLAKIPPNAKGTYILILHAARPRHIDIGRLGEQLIIPGYYCYVGSAFGPGGLAARLRHHATPPRRPHWHIDYLRPVTELVRILYGVHGKRREHDWAALLGDLAGQARSIAGFGASDCHCLTHLFFGTNPPDTAEFARLSAHCFPVDGPVEVIRCT